MRGNAPAVLGRKHMERNLVEHLPTHPDAITQRDKPIAAHMRRSLCHILRSITSLPYCGLVHADGPPWLTCSGSEGPADGRCIVDSSRIDGQASSAAWDFRR
jgi:hypothetical protein